MPNTNLNSRTSIPSDALFFFLDPSLQQGNKIPRWKPRSRVGVYVGSSPEHASSVPLVLSTITGLVSPQFHGVFDDSFSTVECLQTNKIPPNWPILLNKSAVSYVDTDFSKTNLYDRSWFQPPQRESISPTSSHTAPTTVPNQAPLETTISPVTPTNAPFATPVHVSSSTHAHNNMHQGVDTTHTSSTLQQDIPNNSTNIASPGRTHSQSYNTRFKKWIHSNLASTAPPADHLLSIDFTTLSAHLATHNHLSSFHENTLHDQPYLAFGAQSNPDVLHFSAMQHAPDRSDFEKRHDKGNYRFLQQ